MSLQTKPLIPATSDLAQDRFDVLLDGCMADAFLIRDFRVLLPRHKRGKNPSLWI